MCASHTTSLGGSFSALSTSPDFSQSSPCGLACVGGVGIHFCGACVRSGFFFWRVFACGFSVRVSVPFGGGRSLGVVRGVCSLFFVAGFRRGLVAWFLCGLWVVVFSFFFLCSFAGMICSPIFWGVPLCWRPPCGFRFVGVCVCSRPRSCACCPPGPWLGRRVVAGGGVLFAVSSVFRLWLWLGCRSGWF